VSFLHDFKKMFCPATILSTWILALLLLAIPFSAAAQEAPPPDPVGTDLVVAGDIDGTSALLDWTAYDGQSQADIASYRIYAETESFSSVEDLSPGATVNAENQTYTLEGLERGAGYYIAVVPVDASGNADTEISPSATTTLVDRTPPERVHDLRVSECLETALTIAWAHSADSDGDLANYRLRVNNEETGTLIDPARNTHELTGLSPASGYEISVSAIDSSGNESTPLTLECATLLNNPQNITATPNHGSIRLSWDSAAPSNLVEHYAVYVSQSPFESVEDMAPRKTATENTATIYGLENSHTYYFAVTTANISGGEKQSVTTEIATPLFATLVSGSISEDTTWSAANSPYVVTEDISIRYWDDDNETATLTIEPGVEVRFAPGTGMYVGWYGRWGGGHGHHYGALSAIGTPEDPVIFTCNAAPARPGDWKGIYFRAQTNNEKTRLENCRIEYAGDTHEANIYMEDASPSLIENCTVQNSSGHGVYLSNASPLINACNFNNNEKDGIYATGDSYARIQGNDFSSNNGACINSGPDLLSNVSGNAGSGNMINGIQIRGGSVKSNAVTWKNQSLPFIVSGNVTVRYWDNDNETATLTIEPATEIRFDPETGLYVGWYGRWGGGHGRHYGALSATGTPEDPITFTSNADTPAPGDWRGIYFRDETNDSRTRLEHCRVEFGGHTHDANLYCENASPASISHCSIQQSNGYGAYLNNSSTTLDNCFFNHNGKDGIYAAGNSYARISDNNFSQNQEACINIHPDLLSKVTGNAGSGNMINGIQIRGGSVKSNAVTWKNQSLPFIISGNVTVRYWDDDNETATLTIEPATEIRFDPETGLYVGWYGRWGGGHGRHYGALSATGTPEDPITFTSNADTPAPGDWRGIYFRDETNNTASRLEHTLIEYGGNETEANIYLENASPAIHHNTIRAGGNCGIHVHGTDSSASVITCNNLSENGIGIFSSGNAQPRIENNNILNNTEYGIYNVSVTLTAENNWWGDPNGPGQGGDGFFGEVDAVPFLTFESDCGTVPGQNDAPFTPADPAPADGTANINVTEGGTPLPVTISWTCTDPNPADTLSFDVWLGQSAESMSLVAENITTQKYMISDLQKGRTYYWQIIARDNLGAQTTGPAWSFTTRGDSPDLAVSDISWDGSQISVGEPVQLTAVIANTAGGPAVEPFTVSFFVDDTQIHTAIVDQVLPAGATVSVGATWTAAYGEHSIQVFADSGNAIFESEETNNRLTASLPEVEDYTAPAVVCTVPADDARIKEAQQIIIVLADNYGKIDDARVKEGLTVEHPNNGTPIIPGSVSESSDTFTFVPDNLPLPEGMYRVSFTAADTAGNSREHTFGFFIDKQQPAAPTITGGTVYSGAIRIRPVHNRSNIPSITLTGSRDPGTDVFINGAKKYSGSGSIWSIPCRLEEGGNTLEIWLEDEAGNTGPSVWVDILLDTTAPAVSETMPANKAFLNAAPEAIMLRIEESGSGLNPNNCALAVESIEGRAVNGRWELTDGMDFRFIPAEAFTESRYTVSATLEDHLENRSEPETFTFTVDITPPPAPEINPLTSPTKNPSQAITGSKEAHAAIRFNGEQMVDHTQDTNWSHTLSLAEGINSYAVTAVDRAGNASAPVEIQILYDEVQPPPVENLSADGNGDGTFAALDWSDYDESMHGDIDHYLIYQSDSEFSDVSEVGEALDTVEAGTFTFRVTGLEKGAQYWFAVVPVDRVGLFDASVTSMSATVADVIAPEDVTELTVESFENRLTFSWTHSENTAGDLSGYKIYFNPDEEGEVLAHDRRTWEADGLSPANGYPFEITALDADENESQGVSITGATLLDHPAGLTAEAFDGYVRLDWDPAHPPELVKQYAVYVSAADFASVSDRTPALTTEETSAQVAGLENNTPYFFAVTAVNISDGEKPGIESISATPARDESGPEMTEIRYNENLFEEASAITRSGAFRVEASDPAGISRVEFYVDGVLKCKDYNPDYQYHLDIHGLEDGEHILRIVIHDSLGNSRAKTYSFTATLSAPDAPVITSPENGFLTSQSELQVSGTAEKEAKVDFHVNGSQAGNPAAADSTGHFSGRILLSEGENNISARAENRGGISDYSNPVTVTLNTAIPPAPGKMRAEARDNGQIQLSWNAVDAENIAGYHVYRRNAPFTSPAEAVCVTPSPDKDLSYTDLPDTDGTYYYRVTAESSAGNESALSNQAAAVSDSQAPYVISISYAPQGAHDPETGAMAPGRVDIRMDVSEPLLTRPFLSIAPEGGNPLPVELSKASDTRYTGFFNISDTTPSGTAWAVFSGRDKVGNRGTQINEGRSVQIDTHAPEVVRLAVFPAAPVRNEDETQITAVFGLDEPIAEGGTPQIQWRLSGEGRTPMPVDTLSETTAQAGDAQAWQAGFTLPADGGLEAPETLSFLYEGTDHLGNTNTTMSVPNTFQVYQGQLPPLATPTGFSGRPLPEGKIELNWDPVEGAAGYRLFRMGPEGTALSAYEDPMEPGRTSFTDATAADGIYAYAIASIRRENDQTSQSAQSDTVEIRADSLAPPAPESLSLNLASNGIHAAWDSPGYTETITFSLYRSSAEQILSLQGLDPEIEGIEQENTAVVDPNPAPDAHCYAVAAKDAAGNISAPSNSAYLNFDLLPVSSLTVKQTGLQPPVLSWTHAGETAGCHVYIGKGENRRQVNSELISTATYTDTGYAEDERTYAVVAVDENGHESPARTITLPPVEIKPAAGARIKRGIMNALDYSLTSRSGTDITSARLQVKINGRQHVSGSFSLAAGATKTVPVIVGGYSDLPDWVDVTTALIITEDPNETATLTRTGNLEAGEGMLALRMTTEAFTRGGTGLVRFTLENTYAEPIEIITAQKAGKKASDEITVFLEDADGNVIAAEHFLCATGEGVHTLANGHTVARLAPEETFASGPVELTVPANAPDKLTARVLIENIHYHHNRPDEVVMAGMSATAEVGLVDTAYYGEVSEVSPETSTGDTDVSITGRAIDRDTGRPLSAAPLNLVITNDGFEREQTVHTDPSGTFTYSFRPLPGESGTYEVSAVHPDLTERPAQAAFVISKVSLEYAGYKLKIPRNFEHTVSVKATAGMGTTADNLRFEFLAEDQPDGVKPEGVHVTCGEPAAALYPQQHTDLSFSAWADNTADAEGRFVLRLVSDENPDGWRTLPVDFQFRKAAPALWFAPDHVETGTRMGGTVTETLSLENRGTAALGNVTAKLVLPDGTAAPDWVYMPSSQAIGDIRPGQSHSLEVVFAPPETVSEEDYEFRLRLTSDNFETTDINLYAAVTRSGQGSVLFKVTDLYTGTLDADGKAIQGVKNARIRLQNEEVLTEEYSVNTDGLGEALLTDIPAGRYKYRVRADSHQQEIGRIWIKPGSTATEEVFLAYNLVTVEWEVTETTIEDKYEIILSATYETEVPAPVVVIEPASVSLPEMQAGDVFQGEFTLTNQGLVRADEVNLTIPADDEHFKYEFLAEIPESIQAKERITVPYRVTCLQPLTPGLSADAGDATGGGKCGSYVKCAIVGYEWVCANGQWSQEAARHCWTAAYGTDCGSSGGGGGGGSWGVGSGGGGWGGGSGSAPPVTEMPGARCIPKCEDECCEYSCCDPCETPGKCEKLCESVDSAVNLISGEYADVLTDLSVKVPGGTVSVERLAQIGEIRLSGEDRVQAQLAGFFHEAPLRLDTWSSSGHLEKIHYRGATYTTAMSPASGGWSDMTGEDGKKIARVYTRGAQRIIRIGDPPYQWRWEDRYGHWRIFDANGHLMEYGNRAGTLAEVAYRNNSPEDGISGIFDKNGRQVLWYEYNARGRIAAVEDAAGRRVTYTYGVSPGQDQAGSPLPAPLVSVTDVRGHITHYDRSGSSLTITHPNGGSKEISWDPEIGVISSLSYSDFGIYTFGYDYNSRKKERYVMIKSPSGMVKEIWYSPENGYSKTAINGDIIQEKEFRDDGRMVLITDKNGHTTRKEYNEWHQVTRIVHPDGTQESTQYDNTLHKPIRKTDARGIVTAYQHDEAGKLIRKTEAAGSLDERVTTYTYDADGNLTETRVLGTPDAVTSMSYDDAGNMTRITGPEGGVVRLTRHDTMGNVLTKIDARGEKWEYTYDSAGELTAVIDPMGRKTVYTYDAARNKISETRPDETTTRYSYDTRGNMTKKTVIIDPADESQNLVTEFAFTFDDKLARKTDPEGNATLYQYDSRGRLTKAIDPEGNETAMQYGGESGCTTCGASADQPSTIIYPTYEKELDYNARGRKTAERDIAGQALETTYTYDAAGNLTAKTDKNGRTTHYAYDALNRLIRVTDPASAETTYEYDSRDNLIALTDAEGNTTRFEYDGSNRLVKEIRPQGEETAYAYDAAGNLAQKINAIGQKTEYNYDAAGQLTEISYFASSMDNTPGKTVSFTCDANGNLTGYDDGSTSAQYTYDAAERKVSATVDYGAFEKTYTYTYLKNGKKESFTTASGVTYAYQYHNNRLTSVQIPDLGFITIGEYTWNRPAAMTYPGGSSKTFEYDDISRREQQNL